MRDRRGVRRELRVGRHGRRCRPVAALQRDPGRNCRDRERIDGLACRGRSGDHLRRALGNGRRLGITALLQVGVGEVVERMQLVRKLAVRMRRIRGATVGRDRFRPGADARERVRRHVQRMRHGRREGRVAPRGGQRARCERRHVVGVDQVVGQARMVGQPREQPLQRVRRLELQRVGLVGGQRGLRHRERMEDLQLVVLRMGRRQRTHRADVVPESGRLRRRIGVPVEMAHCRQQCALAARRPPCREAGRDGSPAPFDGRRRLEAAERIAPLRQREAPPGHRAARVAAADVLEGPRRLGEPERVQQRDGLVEIRLDGRTTGGREPDAGAADARRVESRGLVIVALVGGDGRRGRDQQYGSGGAEAAAETGSGHGGIPWRRRPTLAPQREAGKDPGSGAVRAAAGNPRKVRHRRPPPR
jgi:hypothetical protein